MLPIRVMGVLLLVTTLLAFGEAIVLAQGDAHGEEPAAASAHGEGEADGSQIDEYQMPLMVRDAAWLVICLIGIVAVLVLGARLPGSPGGFFAAGIAFLAIDPVADLVIFHLLKNDQLRSPALTYAGASVFSLVLGIAFIVLGVHRIREHLQMPGH